MYDATDIARVRELLEQGWSKAAIAKHLRISRRVIYNWEESGFLSAPSDAPRVRASRGSKLDAYELVIVQRLSSNPAMSSRQLLRELRELGYTGELTQLRTFLAPRRRQLIQSPDETITRASSTEVRSRHVG